MLFLRGIMHWPREAGCYNTSMGTLYLVATPIGNLEDISARALRTLREVALIAAEDTRVTRKLLTHYDVHVPVLSYYEHNKLTRLDAILGRLQQGDVALVSDAGTPALNDPGYELVRAALQAGHQVSPVPGPSAPIAALIASGLPTDSFLYLGYLPRKSSERKAALQAVSDLPHTLIFLEAPHRLAESLRDLSDSLGDRRVALARELTKLHEEIWRGSLAEAIDHFKAPRGEFVIIVDGRTGTPSTRGTQPRLLAAIRQRARAGLGPADLAAQLSRQSGWPRREIYRLATRGR